MKKYAEVLENEHTPMTVEELNELAVGSIIDQDRYMRLVAEVKHLRAQMATAYHWIGRKAPSGTATRAYMTCMKEARRIYTEEVNQ